MASLNIHWENIETTLLDMDGTLLDLHFDNYFWTNHLPKRYSETNNTTFDAAYKKLTQIMHQKQGSIHWYCLDFWSDQLKLDIAKMKQEIAHKIAIRPYTKEFLVALRKARKRIILLTNAHEKTLSLKMKKTGLSPYFDSIVSVHPYGIPKEDIAFWPLFAKDYSIDVDTTLLIDDTPSVLKTAERFGIAHLLTIIQPDSQKPCREAFDFPACLHFNEVMPDA